MKGDKVEILRKNGGEYVRHSYPYFSLPLLEKCHVHPKFAIFDAGMKMRNFISENADGFKKDYPSLQMSSYCITSVNEVNEVMDHVN